MAEKQHSLLDSNFPVLLPEITALHFGKDEFDVHIKTLLPASVDLPVREKRNGSDTNASASTMHESPNEQQTKSSAFMTGLLSDSATAPSFDSRDGKMLTENADVAHSTSGQALVDLFFELEDAISASRLRRALEMAWAADSEATLKIVWNARSIHLGKSSRTTFYRAIGWMKEHHPLTLLVNLPYLVRPVIQKKAPKEDKEKNPGEANKDSEKAELIDMNDADSDFEMVEEDGRGASEELEGQPEFKKLKMEDYATVAEFDIKYGVSHGYWKDLLNILAIAANNELKVEGNPKKILNVDKPRTKPRLRDWTEGQKKATNAERHTRATEKLETDKFYQTLHLTVARLFAQQLQLDIARLKSGSKREMKQISLAAKWAPTHKGMHDQHTCIVSTIAELLHPFDEVCPAGVDTGDRELYLKHARIAYQSQTLSPLRKHLQVVERDITAERFEKIKYERVPSLAMKQYTPLFARKDYEHFDQYIEKVAAGKKQISGAVLLPSTLVHAVRPDFGYGALYARASKVNDANAMVEKKLRDIRLRTIDAQWKTLVQRIKDSGTLESSIAVCDVSGSMSSPRFPDGTCPMSSSIGLSLLLAEVVKPPFGGAFITFHNDPQVLRVGGEGDTRSFAEKVKYIEDSPWGGSTDFVAVFEKLILPMARKNKLKQEDMVKQVFVFSDMQFNQAGGGSARWTTSYERIQAEFQKAGYEMPRLIFWNLAGGRGGYEQTSLYDSFTVPRGRGSDVAPKPVTAATEGTALVSGYSQAMLKVFLDNGSFEQPEEEGEEEVVEKEGESGEVVVEKVAKETKKKKQDPLAVVKKAIGHEAYRMLKVVD